MCEREIALFILFPEHKCVKHQTLTLASRVARDILNGASHSFRGSIEPRVNGSQFPDIFVANGFKKNLLKTSCFLVIPGKRREGNFFHSPIYWVREHSASRSEWPPSGPSTTF